MPDCDPALNGTRRLVRDTARRIVERELKPHVEKLEHQTEPPYPTIKRLAAWSWGAGPPRSRS